MLVHADPSTQRMTALNLIMKEIRVCKRHILTLQDENDCLRKENAEIKLIKALPINTVRYCNKNVFLTLYTPAASATMSSNT